MMTVLHVPIAVLAHAGAVAHAHPHGLDAAVLLVAGGVILVLAVGVRARHKG